MHTAARLIATITVVAALAVAARAQEPRTLHRVEDRQLGAGFVYTTARLGLIAKTTDGAYPADDVFYRPDDGALVIGITKHPQRSGFEGQILTPGDCWYSFKTDFPGALVQIVDEHGHGWDTIRLYRPTDGAMRTLRVSILDLPHCDTSDAF